MSTSRRSVLLAVFTTILAASPTSGQQAVGARIDEIFAPWDQADSPGCALGVVQNGELVHAKGYGSANLETGAPITPRTVFYMASVSKQFSAAALVLLAQDGRISLDDDVRHWLPELPDYGQTITLRHLVHHTSGLRDYLTLMPLAGMEYDLPHTPEQILQLVARQRATNFAPGARYLYSNSGYFLIPLVVQRASGTSFREFAQARLFEPLGMTTSHFHDDYRHHVIDRALSYREADSGDVELAFLEKFQQVGSGGLLSNVEDMAKWIANYERPRVGGPAFLDVMHTRGILTNGDTLDYAFGLALGDYKGVRTVRHSGSMMGFKTHLLRFPDDRLGVVCLCNLNEIDPGELVERVADVYLETRFDEALAPLAGAYHSDDLGVTWTLQVKRGDLQLLRPDQDPTTLASRGDNEFAIPDGPRLTFERDAGGRATGFTVNAGRALGVRFGRR